MKYLYLSILVCLPALLFAQSENKKYLEGAVPVVDGRVVFDKEFSTPTLSQGKIYESVLKWAHDRFKMNGEFKSRVLYSNKEKGEIACLGDEYMVFSSSFLSLDRSKITYRLSVFCSPGKCKMEVAGIRYVYGDKGNNSGKISAEEYITDPNALNKNKTKLLYGTGKFRKGTIDLVDLLSAGIQTALGANIVNNNTVVPPQAAVPAQTAVPASLGIVTDDNQGESLRGYKQIAPGKIPGNIIKMLSEDWMLVTAGNDAKFNMMTANWGGLGYLYDKPVAFCFINPSSHTHQLLDNGDTYTLSFYTETYRDAMKYCGSYSGKDTDKVKSSGLTPITTPTGSKAFGEAWLIIECRKMISQPIYPDSMHDAILKHAWEGKQTHTMYIGEIINAWVK